MGLVHKLTFVPRYVRQTFYTSFNKMMFKSAGAQVGRHFVVRNRFYLKMYRGARLTIGDNFTLFSGEGINPIARNVRGCFYLNNNARLQIGNNVGMSSPSIWCDESITIGNNVKIGALTTILDTDCHSIDYINRRTTERDAGDTKTSPVVIEDDVLIGANSMILKGVHIGARTVIGGGQYCDERHSCRLYSCGESMSGDLRTEKVATMKILQVNTFYAHGSTGRIVMDLKEVATRSGLDAYAAYGIDMGNPIQAHEAFRMQGKLELIVSKFRSRIFAHHGFYNKKATKRLIGYINEIQPYLIHLHNTHNHYLHNGMLFDYIKRHRIPVVWTLHDCWSFTGWCAYFDYAHCDKWRTHCHDCQCKADYPYAWFSARAKSNFNRKQATFNGVDNLTLVSPSRWLASLTRQSFLRGYPVKVINNGVDTNVFLPSPSDLKQRLGISGKKMLLAIAAKLEKRKGAAYLFQIPAWLHDDECLVLLGLTDRQVASLPKHNCIGISYTNSTQELAELYSAADVFINPTLEDNFPTTNIEALACGTPVVTFDTGGSVEAVLDGEDVITKNNIRRTSVGAVVPQGDLDSMMVATRAIIGIGKEKYEMRCRQKAVERYNKETQYLKYIELYKELIK